MLSSFDKIRDKILAETFLKLIETKYLRRKYTKIYKIFKIYKTFNSANHSWLYYSRLGQVKEVVLFEKLGGGGGGQRHTSRESILPYRKEHLQVFLLRNSASYFKRS